MRSLRPIAMAFGGVLLAVVACSSSHESAESGGSNGDVQVPVDVYVDAGQLDWMGLVTPVHVHGKLLDADAAGSGADVEATPDIEAIPDEGPFAQEEVEQLVPATGPDWTYTIEPHSRAVPGLAVSHDGKTIYAASVSLWDNPFASFDFLHAIDADTGEEKWRLSFNGGWAATPVVKHDGSILIVTNSSVYYGNDPNGVLYRQQIAPDGTPEWWHFSQRRLRSHCPAVDAAGDAYFLANDSMLAIDHATGLIKWETPVDVAPWVLGNSFNRGAASPLLMDGRLYLLDNDRELEVLDAETGAILLTTLLSLDAGPCCPIAPGADGELLVNNNTGLIGANKPGTHGLDALTGDFLWHNVNRTGAGGPVVSANGVVYGSSSGNFGIKGSQTLWLLYDWHFWNMGKTVGARTNHILTASNRIVAGSADGVIPYALLSTSGDILYLPDKGPFSASVPGLPKPPVVVPRPGQLVYASRDDKGMAVIYSIAAPVDVPAPGLWSTMHGNQQNTRRAP